MSKQNPVVKDSLTPQVPQVGDSVRRLVRNMGFCHEIEGFLLVSPSEHKGGTPQIVDFRHSNGAADRRAARLEKVYGKKEYPCGLIVVPCEVHFSIPNTELTDAKRSVE